LVEMMVMDHLIWMSVFLS